MYLKNAINQSIYSYCERFHTQLVWVFFLILLILMRRRRKSWIRTKRPNWMKYLKMLLITNPSCSSRPLLQEYERCQWPFGCLWRSRQLILIKLQTKCIAYKTLLLTSLHSNFDDNCTWNKHIKHNFSHNSPHIICQTIWPVVSEFIT